MNNATIAIIAKTAFIGLLLCILCQQSDACRPTRKQYKEVDDRLGRVVIDRSDLPASAFKLEHCPSYECQHLVIDSSGQFTIVCKDSTKDTPDNSMALYLRTDGTPYLRNSGFCHEAMMELAACLEMEFRDSTASKTLVFSWASASDNREFQEAL